MTQLLPAGTVAWAHLGDGDGREQSGRRPVVVISSPDFNEAVDTLVLALPCTSRERGWLNHIRLTGAVALDRTTFAMTEQPRTISVTRLRGVAGSVDDPCLRQICRWVHAWIADF